MNQKTRVKQYMEQFGSVTTFQAFTDLGVTDLPKRISELRADGVKIAQKRESARNRYGEKTHYMRYRLGE